MSQASTGKRILIVSADRAASDELGARLTRFGFQTHVSYTHAAGAKLAQSEQYSLVIADVNLEKGKTGCEIAKSLRANGSPTPVILRSDNPADELLTLQWEANYFVLRETGVLELVAVIEMLLRDREWYVRESASMPRVYQTGSLYVDVEKRYFRTAHRDGHISELEVKTLAFLIARAPLPVDRMELENEIWGLGHDRSETALGAIIKRLRDKIEVDPLKPQYLITVIGHGYAVALVPEPSIVSLGSAEPPERNGIDRRNGHR
jgi:DNA-binding response OmpR family regulator